MSNVYHGANDLFNYIVRYKTAHDGNSPTIRHLAAEFDVSTSVIAYQLSRLVAQGRIRRAGGVACAIEVVGGQWTYAAPPVAVFERMPGVRVAGAVEA